MIDVVPNAGAIALGKQGENRAVRVTLPNIRAGAGSILLLHQRSDDQKPYPVPVVEADGGIIWTVSSTDTAYPGRGQAELQWLGADGAVVKSVTYQTNIVRALTTPGAVPDEPLKPYTQAVAKDAQAAKDAAASATKAARSAEANATQAGLSAENAAKTLQKLKDGIASGDFRGENGKSAYQLAVDAGFDGTETQWLESLKGAPGDTTAADAAAEAAKKAAKEAQKAAEDCTGNVSGLKEDLGNTKTQLSELITEIWKSPLVSKKVNVESIGLVVGAYPSPMGTFNPDIKYNASVVLQLNAGDIIGFTEAGYSVKFGKRTDMSFSSWMPSIKINDSGEYTVVVRKDNFYGDLTSQIDAINKIFGIITTTNELNIPSNYVSGSMINYETIVDPVIDVVRDRGIDNTGAVDVTEKIQECLDISKELGRATLFFRKGTYKVSKALDYCNDTELIFAKNAVLSCVHKDGTVLTNIKSISNGSNYDRGSLTIKGGIIKRNYTELDSGEQRSIGIQCCQLKYLSIIGTEFIDICAGNHLIDMSGIGSVVIDNCIFRGMHLPEVIRPTKEANYSYTKDDGTVMYTDLEMLQIDHGKGLSTPSLEENPTNNVVIRNCIFRPNVNNPHSVIYRPIGMHSVSSIANYENIEIYNNQFEHSLGRVISMSNAVNIKINNNRFINTTNPMFSAIIRFTLMIFGKYYNCKNIEIIGNTVLYKTETNGNHFLSADLSNGTVKAINGVVKWNNIGSLDIDTNNLVNFEIP